MKPETASYMMLFFAILLSKQRGIALRDSVTVVPLTGGARMLADELSNAPRR
jgi:hypothetical protein